MKIPKNKTHSDYIHQINIVFKFIDANLENELTLDVISNIVHYSPFHFHRIFKAFTNENLNAYILRKRIEKAAEILTNKSKTSIGEVALQTGFRSNSSFTKAFKKKLKTSPSFYRKNDPKKISKNGQESLLFESYIYNINNLKYWIETNAVIQVKELPVLNFAAISKLGMENIDTSFKHLIVWANTFDLMKNRETKFARIFHDNYKITSIDKIRTSLCLLTNKEFKTKNEIHPISTQKGKYIVANLEITLDEFEKAWGGLFLWLSQNNYTKTASPPFEIYHNNHKEHPDKKFIVDFHIPIL